MQSHLTAAATELTTQSHSTETELTTKRLLDRKTRLARINEIENQGKTTTSTSWSFLGWNLMVTTAEGIQEAFRKLAREIPFFSLLYPDHPGTKEILGSIGFSAWSMALKVLSPVALVFSWINTAIAFKQLWQKENKTIWDYANAFLNLVGSVAWSVLLGVGAAGAGAAIATALTAVPYLIPAVFGVYALYGFAKCAKNCYLAFSAWREGRSDECKAYLWNAGKQLVSVITNTLALVTSLFLGVKMQEAVDLIKDNFEAGKQAINFCFEKAGSLLYALGAAVGVGAVMNTTKMNKETLNAILHPVDTFKKGWYAVKANPLLILKAPVALLIKLPLRVAALVTTGLIQGIVKGVLWLVSKKTSKPEAQAVVSAERSAVLQGSPIEAEEKRAAVNVSKSVAEEKQVAVNVSRHVAEEKHDTASISEHGAEEKDIAADASVPAVKKQASTTRRLTARLVAENQLMTPESVDARIQSKLAKVDASFPSMEHAPDTIVAKRFQLNELSKFVNGESRYRSVEEIERSAKMLSKNGLYHSNYRSKGSEVRELTEAVRVLAAPAA